MQVMSCLHNDRASHMMMTSPDPHTTACCDSEGQAKSLLTSCLPFRCQGALACLDPMQAMCAGNCQHDGHVTSTAEDATSAHHAHSNSSGGETSKDDGSTGDDEDDEADSGDDSEEGDCVFSASYRPALELMLTSKDPVGVKQLPLPTDEERLGLSMQLWADGLLCNLGPANKASAPKQPAANGIGKASKRSRK